MALELLTAISTTLIFAALLSHPQPASSHGPAGEFSYKEGSPDGPEDWGMLRPEWAACGQGRMQSPIDLSAAAVKIVVGLEEVHGAYMPSNATLVNTGHSIEVAWVGGAGGIQIDGTTYFLKQCHWHWPSEHKIDGQRFSLEIHMVHESADNKIAVVGVLYEYGMPDTFLTKMEGYIRALGKTYNATEAVGVVDPREVRGGSGGCYNYMGSLTAPPCTEGVSWIVMHQVKTVSRSQVEMLKTAVSDKEGLNARPIQPTNFQEVELHLP
uniref:Carbonic anhydrase n=1 Tax=Anthurium amnicola TaxID=1678845 RepID=A0A1D1YPE2_9ARAE